MELSEYQNIFDHEATHFFYQVNHAQVISFLEQFVSRQSSSKKLSILDAGCGTGLLLKKLAKYGRAQGVDISPEAIKFCKKRKVTATLGSLTKLPFKSQSFDVVVSVDVLYHKLIKNDAQALAEIKRVLKPGGILIIRVPANKWLKLAHDTHVHTRQRYTTQELGSKLEKAKFKLLKLSYVNATFLLLAIIKYGSELMQPAATAESGVAEIPTILNQGLVKMGVLEEKILAHGTLPFGLGVMAVAQK